MLTELRVRDFAIIESLDVEFSGGLNVLTGETGAGKSIIVDSIALLLGDKAEPGMVRAGAERALIEGVFTLAHAQPAHPERVEGREGAGVGNIAQLLTANGLENDDPATITLSREVRASGRTICRVNGRSVTQNILRELGELLVDVHGQSEHLSLLRVKEHINLLDHYANVWELRAKAADKFHEVRKAQRDLKELVDGVRERERRRDMLKFQVEEIRAAKLKPNEEAALLEEHTRLSNAEALSEYASEAFGALYESTREQPAALDQIAQASRAIQNLIRFDKQFEDYAKALGEATAQIDEVARMLRDYRDQIEFNPKRLAYVESRLEGIKKLKRKYGDTLDSVILFGENAEKELELIETSAERIEEIQGREKALRGEFMKLAKDLSARRKTAAANLGKAVETELQDLRMGGATFAVQLLPLGDGSPDGHGFDATGVDRVEFMIAPNLGEGLKPLVKVASGGESARLMLALKAVLSRADSTPTLIFDEIDQGIGGRVGTVVGEKLSALAAAHQVLCITHLPQLAGFADAHFKVEKLLHDGRTTTSVRSLNRKQRVEELAQMLGTEGKPGLQSAEQLLRK